MKQTVSIASILAILASIVTLISWLSGNIPSFLISWALSIPTDTGWTITLIVGIITASVITALVLSIIRSMKEK